LLLEWAARGWFSWETRKRVIALQAALREADGSPGPIPSARDPNAPLAG
jgi:hypothetical protein